MSDRTLKIVILGPESTGKSMLCEQLAANYHTDWVKEFAREFLHENGPAYVYEDLFSIAQGQLVSEIAGMQIASSKQAIMIFMDTDLHVIQVWSEFVFNKTDNRILKTIAAYQCDLFLLCNIDLPWQADELREYPDLESRQKLFHHYKDIMINQQVPFAVISGNNEERLQNAVEVVEKFIAGVFGH